MIRWIDRIATICKAALLLLVLSIGLKLYAELAEPTGSRPYAETWMQSPISELLSVQGDPRQVEERADGVEGKIHRYRFDGWRGMKGKVYPGTFFGALLDSRQRMQSRATGIFGPDSGLYCDIEFVSDDTGVIEAITYSGNDCG